MRRGFTLFELVAALTLFGSVLGVCLAWVQFAARSTTRVAQPMRWRAAAEQALLRIEEDLRIGDLDAGGGARAMLKARVEDERLVVRTRGAGGEVEHEYALEGDGRLARAERPAGARATPPGAARRPLLTEVARFEALADPTARRLAVRIVSRDGRAVAEEWSW